MIAATASAALKLVEEIALGAAGAIIQCVGRPAVYSDGEVDHTTGELDVHPLGLVARVGLDDSTVVHDAEVVVGQQQQARPDIG